MSVPRPPNLQQLMDRAAERRVSERWAYYQTHGVFPPVPTTSDAGEDE